MPQYPEALAEFAALVAATLIDEGVAVDSAQSLSRAITERVRLILGGTYIPRGISVDVERVRRDIALRWNGTNTRELCLEHGISERRLRQLAAKNAPRARY